MEGSIYRDTKFTFKITEAEKFEVYRQIQKVFGINFTISNHKRECDICFFKDNIKQLYDLHGLWNCGPTFANFGVVLNDFGIDIENEKGINELCHSIVEKHKLTKEQQFELETNDNYM